MPSNIIIFEAEYVSELVSSMNTACELMSEAVESLKKASMHEGWKCKECVRISAELDDLNVSLGRLDEGVNETTRVLGGSVSRFATLEESYRSQAKDLTDDITSNHGYTAEVRTPVDDPSGPASGGDTPGNTTPSSGQQGGSSGSRGGNHHSGSSQGGSGHGRSGGHGGRSEGRGESGGHGEHGAESGSESGRGSHGGSSASSAAGGSAGAAMSGRVADSIRQNTQPSGTPGGGFASGFTASTVNLPVTHIPDKPEAAARGTRDTQAIADAAISRVADTIAGMLNRNTGISEQAAYGLVETYNAGKVIVDSSVSIIANPSMPHTQERLAMAEGIVSLSNYSSVYAQPSAPSPSATASAPASSSASSGYSGGTVSSTSFAEDLKSGIEDFRNGAEHLIPALDDIDGGSELQSILTSLTSNDSQSFMGNFEGGDSFFEKVIRAISQRLNGGEGASSSSRSSSPFDEFMSTLVNGQG